MSRKKLSDILGSKEHELVGAWETTKVAVDFGALPEGEYTACIVDGELGQARTGTPRYKLTFEVAEGPLSGRRFWHDLWLTEVALPITKRELLKLGVKSFEQLD